MFFDVIFIAIIITGIISFLIKSTRRVSYALFVVGFLSLGVSGLMRGHVVALAGLLLSAYSVWQFVNFNKK
jgi:hypothetical protein